MTHISSKNHILLHVNSFCGSFIAPFDKVKRSVMPLKLLHNEDIAAPLQRVKSEEEGEI